MNKTVNETKKLGFGLMRLPGKDGKIDIETSKKMVDSFLSAGFTYFDTAYVYYGGDSERSVRELLTSRYDRSKFKLATKLALWMVKQKEDMQAQFDTQLERTGAGYFDYYLLHSMDREKFRFANEIGAWDFIKGLKEKGFVKHIGFSFHDKADVLEQALIEHPETEFVQLQINYYDWDDENIQSRLCYEVARKYGKDVIVMEPVKGGMLANLAPSAREILKGENEDASVASFAIRYAASLDGVITVLSGMSDMAQTEDNISYMKDFVPLSESERKAIENVVKTMREIPRIQCTRCSYCTDGCPSQIKIPGIIAAYNNWLTYRNDGSEKDYGKATENAGKASDCVKCGACMEICPQHLEITKILEDAASAFEK